MKSSFMKYFALCGIVCSSAFAGPAQSEVTQVNLELQDIALVEVAANKSIRIGGIRW